MPWDLSAAVTHAALILSWYEHLSEDEIPPRWMWTLHEELEDHFKWVKRKRNGGDDFDDDEPSGPVIHNEYARERGRHVKAGHNGS